MDEPTRRTAQVSGAPAGEGEYVIRAGECISSVAYENGFFPDTLWNLPENSALRAARTNPNALLPGDRLTVPPVRPKDVDGATEVRHRFRRRGVPERLRVRLVDVQGEARADLEYAITVDGRRTQGRTDGNGELELPISPSAREGLLRIPATGEEYPLRLGRIDPIDTLSGVQARLCNLGFPCGDPDGIPGPATRDAIEAFQESRGLAVTGEPDEQTRQALEVDHGS